MQHPDNDSAFDAIVASAGDLPVFLKFSAEWCGPCKMIAGEVAELATANAGKMVFIHVDVDALESTSEKFGIEAMPTCIVIKHGQKQGEPVTGASMDKIKALVAANL